jgi:hypothetical protein
MMTLTYTSYVQALCCTRSVGLVEEQSLVSRDIGDRDVNDPDILKRVTQGDEM